MKSVKIAYTQLGQGQQVVVNPNKKLADFTYAELKDEVFVREENEKFEQKLRLKKRMLEVFEKENEEYINEETV